MAKSDTMENKKSLEEDAKVLVGATVEVNKSQHEKEQDKNNKRNPLHLQNQCLKYQKMSSNKKKQMYKQ